MCGVSGFYIKHKNFIQNEKTILEDFLGSIRHRGPDDSATYMDGVVGLGMRRLAILDLQKDLYPFYSSDRSVALVFNGEIYNYKDLRDTLMSLGFKFKTNCDAEVIIRGYEKWGIGVIKRLQGMFAISLWDKKKNKLFLIRDRLGVKPLYYVDTPSALFFSSEAKSFYSLPKELFVPKIDEGKLQILLGFMFLPDSKNTIVSGVKKVLPGHYLEVSDDNFKEIRYWSLSAQHENKNITFEEAVNELEKLLNETVRMHLMSDVPLGLLLSGGLDSSLLTALIVKNKLSGNTVNTYTAKFEHKFNESRHARKVAEYLGTKHHEILIDAAKVSENIEEYIPILDDLTTFDGGIFTTKLLCDEIKKKGIKVLLLGEGADEVFGGYSWFGLSQYPFRSLPNFVKNSLYYYAISRNVSYKIPQMLRTWNSVYKDTMFDTFRNISSRELTVQLPNHLLMKVDKGTMSSSIEARVPYLDHKLVEFAYSLPQEFKLKGSLFDFSRSNEKHILREVASRYLPESIYTRKKRGFMLPIDSVIHSKKSKVKDYLFDANSTSKNLFSEDELNKLLSNADNSTIQTHRDYMLWRLFLLEIWAKNYNIGLS